MWERLAALPLEIEGYTLEKLQGGERVTTLLRLRGDGQEGVGEEIGAMRPEDHDAFVAQAPLPLAGTWTLESFCEHLATLEQWEEPPEWGDMPRRWRNWAYESAALDLALRQAGLPLHEALGREPRPLTFVNSLGLGDDPSTDTIARRLERYPTVGFKLDAAPNWSPEIIEMLAGTGMVRTIDFKGRYGLEVSDEDALGAMYDAVLEAFPGRDLRGPARAVHGPPRGAADRVRRAGRARRGHHHADHQRQAVTDRRTAAAVRDLRARGGGGPADVRRRDGRARPARRQIQLLASIFHPDSPNDVAPSAFNLPEPPAGLPASPIDPEPPRPGFR